MSPVSLAMTSIFFMQRGCMDLRLLRARQTAGQLIMKGLGIYVICANSHILIYPFDFQSQACYAADISLNVIRRSYGTSHGTR